MSLSNHPNLLGHGAVAPAGSTGVVGGPSSSTDTALVRWNGTTGTIIQDGVVLEATDSGTLTGPTANATTTAVGSAFTNQPLNDSVTVASSDAADIGQVVTLIGTTTAVNTVVLETIILNGTTAVVSVKVDWGKILAVKLSASCAGTVTISKTTALATITTITTTNLSKGVNLVAAANQLAYGRTLSTVSDGATTKQIGFQGTNTSNVVIYDSKPLNGATAVLSNSSFRTVTEIYTGDVEVARTETVTTNGAWTLTAGSISLVPTGASALVSISGSLTYGGVTFAATTTGSGSLVGSASPTFTGTVTAAIANFSGAISAGVSSAFTTRLFINATSRNQMLTDGTAIAPSSSANDLALRNDQGDLYFAAGSSTPQVKIASATGLFSTSASLTMSGTLTGAATFATAATFSSTLGVTGLLTATAGVTTGAGVTNAAGTWKLGALRTGVALTPSTTNVIQVDIGGTLYSLLTATTNP